MAITEVAVSEDKRTKDGKRMALSSETGPKKKRKSDNFHIQCAPQLVDEGAASKSERKARREAKRLRKQEGKPSSASATNAPNATNADTKLSQLDYEAYLKSNCITIYEPVDSTTRTAPFINFEQLPVPDALKGILEGFVEPTPIQACSWPALLAGLDVIGIAETGSGKTLAFSIPGIARLVSQGAGSTIKTHETMSKLGTLSNLRSVCVYGGVSKGNQIRELKKVNPSILVGTPGRILDLVNDGTCDLSNVNYLVLDEADRMLDKGFENDVRRLMEMTKSAMPVRQTVMFSATWPVSVKQLANAFLRNPIRIVVGSDELTANKKVIQAVDVFDDPRSKDGRLFALLRKLFQRNKSVPSLEPHRMLVFVLYKKEADRVERCIRRQGYTVAGLHGDLSQQQRIAALNGFKEGLNQILVATDVAARGLDIPNVRAVINYSFPLTIEDYIHRIGRTGRGGKNGESFTFFTGENHERALAGEFARVLREGGFDTDALKKFPMTVKKKEHSVYGAFFRDDIEAPVGPQKIRF